MADFIQIDAAGAVALYENTDENRVNAVGAVALYENTDENRVNAAGVVVLYSGLPPVYRVFPTAPGQRITQNLGIRRATP